MPFFLVQNIRFVGVLRTRESIVRSEHFIHGLLLSRGSDFTGLGVAELQWVRAIVQHPGVEDKAASTDASSAPIFRETRHLDHSGGLRSRSSGHGGPCAQSRARHRRR